MTVYEDNADLYDEDYAEFSAWYEWKGYPQSDIMDEESLHSSCKADWTRYIQLRAAYFFRWPHHCRACGGAGGSYYEYDPSAAGVSLGAGSMIDVDPCLECTGCPRCGTKLPEEWWGKDEECPVCDWDWMRSYEEDEACPEPPFCSCQEPCVEHQSILGRV